MRKIVLTLLFIVSSSAKAIDNEKLKSFLVYCGYGTGIGALVGAASLAITDDPGSKLSNIAKGASLGLYVGIGVGLYKNSKESSSIEGTTLLPLLEKGQVRGVQLMSLYQF